MRDSNRYKLMSNNRCQRKNNKLGRKLRHLLIHKLDKTLMKNSKLMLANRGSLVNIKEKISSSLKKSIQFKRMSKVNQLLLLLSK